MLAGMSAARMQAKRVRRKLTRAGPVVHELRTSGDSNATKSRMRVGLSPLYVQRQGWGLLGITGGIAWGFVGERMCSVEIGTRCDKASGGCTDCLYRCIYIQT